MQALGPIIWAFIAAFAMPLVTKILRGVGFGVMTYYGMDFAIDYAETLIMGKFNGLPIELWQIMRIMGLHEGISIVISCIAASIALRMVAGGVSQTVWRAPNSNPIPGNGTWIP